MLKEFSEVLAVTICLLAFNHTGALTADIQAGIVITGFACLVLRLIFRGLNNQ